MNGYSPVQVRGIFVQAAGFHASRRQQWRRSERRLF
jgi:hypothetical protein